MTLFGHLEKSIDILRHTDWKTLISCLNYVTKLTSCCNGNALNLNPKLKNQNYHRNIFPHFEQIKFSHSHKFMHLTC